MIINKVTSNCKSYSVHLFFVLRILNELFRYLYLFIDEKDSPTFELTTDGAHKYALLELLASCRCNQEA